jgi:hypothetical protein
MGTRGSFPGGKADGAWSWSFPTSVVKLYLHFANTPSWRGAQLKKQSTETTLPFFTFHLYLLGPNTFFKTFFSNTLHLWLSFEVTAKLTHQPTNQPTLWSRVLDKLTVTQLVKKFVFYGTRRFITAFTTARHWSLSWIRLNPTHAFPT